jgi:hypothetical protein
MPRRPPHRPPADHGEDNINRALGRLEGKVDAILHRLDDIGGTQTKHDDRISALEHAHTRIKTYALVGSSLISIGVTAVLKYFGIA